MYKKVFESDSIQRLSDGAFIPADPANRDYAEYLSWVEAGNTPEEADAPPPVPYTVLREQAYKAEADPLFFQEQRGEVPAGTWEAKIEEIKVRYPKV